MTGELNGNKVKKSIKIMITTPKKIAAALTLTNLNDNSNKQEFSGVEAVVYFLNQCNNDPQVLSEYEFKNCLELIFSLKVVGLFTTQNDWRQFIGPMEYFIITEKNKEPFNESSSLWSKMYGKTFLRYVASQFSTLSDHEINRIIKKA